MSRTLDGGDRPPVRRGFVGAGIVALWGALLAAIGAPLLGLALAALAAFACLVLAIAPRLRRPTLPRRPGLPARAGLPARPSLPAVPVRAGARRVVELCRPAVRSAGDRTRLVAARVPPLLRRGRELATRLAAEAAPLVRAAFEAVVRAARAVVAPVERRRRRAAAAKEAWQLNALGVEHRREGRGTQAVDAHERAVTLFRQLADDRGEGLALNNLGLALMAEGDDVGAVDAFERALALLARAGDRQSEGRVLANLGTLHRRLDRREAALVYWRQALTRLDADSPEHERMAELVELAS